jgi:Zn finger protein HypA/HybF involved in hydrogenase expression
MFFVTDEQLEAVRIRQGEKYKWKAPSITSYYSEVHRRTVYLPEIQYQTISFQCLRCNAHYIHDECPNCGGQSLKIGSGPGIYCNACDLGFSSWNCEKCGTKNPVSNTMFLLEKEGCFIATAVYGTPLAPEIAILQRFRETELRPRRAGRWIIGVYERYSPPLADAIAPHPTARLWVRRLLLAPVISAIRQWFP